MPRHPIYIKLLSNETQSVIGQPHSSAKKAMNILLQEGFCYNNYIDIFDGGPTLEAQLLKINTIESSIIVTIKNLSDELSSADYLLANTKLDFRATIDSILINIEDKTCTISKKTAKLLQVVYGDNIRIAPLEITKGILDASSITSTA
jgi:arginine N-succinyltransferase